MSSIPGGQGDHYRTELPFLYLIVNVPDTKHLFYIVQRCNKQTKSWGGGGGGGSQHAINNL